MLLLDSLDHGDTSITAGPAVRRDGAPPGPVAHRAEIDRATGMITVQLGVGAAEAFARLRAYAYARDQRLTDVARDIVTRRLRLYPDPERDTGP